YRTATAATIAPMTTPVAEWTTAAAASSPMAGANPFPRSATTATATSPASPIPNASMVSAYPSGSAMATTIGEAPATTAIASKPLASRARDQLTSAAAPRAITAAAITGRTAARGYRAIGSSVDV